MDNPAIVKRVDIKEILKEFVNEWKKKEGYLGVMLTGSRATNTETAFSDVDLLVVLSNEITHKERGNRIVDGVVVEYIAYPESLWSKLFNEEKNKNQRMWIGMWTVGVILDDVNGDIKKLKKEAKQFFSVPIKKLSNEKLEMAKYQLWDGLGNLKDLHKTKNINFNPLYYLQLSKIINSFAQYLGISMPAVAKWDVFFTDQKYRNVYKLVGFDDGVFVNSALKLMDSPNMNQIEILTNYVLNKMGGFQIDGWNLKEPL